MIHRSILLALLASTWSTVPPASAAEIEPRITILNKSGFDGGGGIEDGEVRPIFNDREDIFGESFSRNVVVSGEWISSFFSSAGKNCKVVLSVAFDPNIKCHATHREGTYNCQSGAIMLPGVGAPVCYATLTVTP